MRRVIALPNFPVAQSGIPISLAAVAASGSQINLTATYSGLVGVTTYNFYCLVGYSWVLIASQASATYAYTGLTLNTAYAFQATVNTADGRTSMPSPVVSVTTSAGSRNYGAINAAGYDYATPNQPFANLLKSAVSGSTYYGYFPWNTVSGGAGSSTGEEGYVQADANGYPTSLVAGNGFSGTQKFTKICCLTNYTQSISGIPNTAHVYPPGLYTFQVSGGASGTQMQITGDVDSTYTPTTTGGCSASLSGSTLTININQASGASGTVTFNVATPSSSGLVLWWTAVPSASNYPTNMYLGLQSLLTAWNAGTYINPLLLSQWSGASLIRFMDWLSTNPQMPAYALSANIPANTAAGYTGTLVATSGGPSSANWNRPSGTYPVLFANGNSGGTPDTPQTNTATFTFGSSSVTFNQAITYAVTGAQQALMVPWFTSWANRPQVANLSWNTPLGCPLEVCVAATKQLAAANGTNVDCWTNVPAQFNSFQGYAAAFNSSYAAWLVANQPTGKHVVEYTNEYWNDAQPQINRAFASMGTHLMPAQTNVYEAADEFYGIQVGALSAAIKSAYGANFTASNVVISMGAQLSGSGGGYHLRYAMNAPDWVALGNVAPYTQGVGAVHFPVYWTNVSSTDFNNIIANNSGQAAQLSCLFGLMYSNTYGGTTYSNSIGASGIVGGVIAAIPAATTYNSSQPWGSLPVYGYEGGSNFSVSGAAETLVIAAMRDTRMQYVMYDPTNQLSTNAGFLPMCIAQGFSFLAYYYDCGVYGGYQWGLAESAMQTVAAPKLAGQQAWMAA
jgi:hypothetical protein